MSASQDGLALSTGLRSAPHAAGSPKESVRPPRPDGGQWRHGGTQLKQGPAWHRSAAGLSAGLALLMTTISAQHYVHSRAFVQLPGHLASPALRRPLSD
ncbi:hypothetical protein CMUS01_07281 [Colletotrichum musicola]|uniref:Uncharacterized protein n=1 Tax=Colletotrichum musicola TaxID=2175873 RepID=A0A8H6KIV5_9PEZI|nr:hypothetical protein CMUS01_07281 [Colletotrichum musicola]